MAGRLAEMSALVNKEQLMETLTSAYASPHVYLYKCMVHILKLEGAVFKNVVEKVKIFFTESRLHHFKCLCTTL